MRPRVGAIERLTQRPLDPSGRGDVAFADLRFPTPSGKIEFARDEAARAVGRRRRARLRAARRRARVGAGRASRCSSSRARRATGSTRSSAISTGCATSSARTCSTCTRTMRRRAAWRRATRVRCGTTAAGSSCAVRIDHGHPAGRRARARRAGATTGDPDVNVLTDAGVTDMNHGATFYECLVEVGRGREPRESRPDGLVRRAGRTASGRRARSSASERLPQADWPQADRPAAVQAGFLLDLGRCVGCGACVLACRLENGWSSDNPWRRVLPLNLAAAPGRPDLLPVGRLPPLRRPACLAACPSRRLREARGRRGGAPRVALHRLPVLRDGLPVRRAALRRRRSGVMTKCHLCHHRLDAGEAPACVAACPTEALRELEPAPGSRRPASGRVGVPGLAPTGAVSGEPGVPGFADVAGCSPNIRFVAPRGRRRAALFEALWTATSADRADRPETSASAFGAVTGLRLGPVVGCARCRPGRSHVSCAESIRLPEGARQCLVSSRKASASAAGRRPGSACEADSRLAAENVRSPWPPWGVPPGRQGLSDRLRGMARSARPARRQVR